MWSRRTGLRLIVILFTFFTGLIFSQVSYAGTGFSEQGNALSKALRQELINTGVCTEDKKCSRSFHMYRRDGNRIELNLYEETDSFLAAKMTAFLLEKGLKITGGMPITLRAFPQPKEHYLEGVVGNG